MKSALNGMKIGKKYTGNQSHLLTVLPLFFEFYEDEFSAVFFLQPRTLAEFNLALLSCVCSWLEIEDNFLFAKTYTALTPKEEKLINPKQEGESTFPKYTQVFDSKYGFLPNLSILDLIFNLGPESYAYLKQVANPSPNG